MKRMICILLCAGMLGGLAGCGGTGPQESHPEEPSAVSSGEAAASSGEEPLQEEASGESTPQEPSEAVQLSELDQQAFEGYFADFACFFHQPAETPAELPLDYSMGYFLVYEAWRLGTEAGSSYQQDANLLYLIPEEEISETAEALLGMESFDPGKVAEWPFGRNPLEGFQLYSEESSLPYLNVVSQAVSCQDDTVTVQAVLETGMGNEGETPPNVSLIYEFQRIPSESGELYRLLSISEA